MIPYPAAAGAEMTPDPVLNVTVAASVWAASLPGPLYTMPQADNSGASSDLQKKRNDVYARLQEHEEGHVGLARQACRDIEREIGSLRRSNCGELNEVADRTGKDAQKQLEAASVAYDARTVTTCCGVQCCMSSKGGEGNN